MRRRYRDQALHINVRRLQPRDHIPGVEATHGVSNDVDGFAVSMFRDLLAEASRSLLDASRGRDGGGYDLCAFVPQGFFDAMPVMYGR